MMTSWTSQVRKEEKVFLKIEYGLEHRLNYCLLNSLEQLIQLLSERAGGTGVESSFAYEGRVKPAWPQYSRNHRRKKLATMLQGEF